MLVLGLGIFAMKRRPVGERIDLVRERNPQLQQQPAPVAFQ